MGAPENLWDQEKESGARTAMGGVGWWQHRGTWQAQGVLGGGGGITQGTKCLGTDGTAAPGGLWTQIYRYGGQPVPDLSITQEVESS